MAQRRSSQADRAGKDSPCNAGKNKKDNMVAVRLRVMCVGKTVYTASGGGVGRVQGGDGVLLCRCGQIASLLAVTGKAVDSETAQQSKAHCQSCFTGAVDISRLRIAASAIAVLQQTRPLAAELVHGARAQVPSPGRQLALQTHTRTHKPG